MKIFTKILFFFLIFNFSFAKILNNSKNSEIFFESLEFQELFSLKNNFKDIFTKDLLFCENFEGELYERCLKNFNFIDKESEKIIEKVEKIAENLDTFLDFLAFSDKNATNFENLTEISNNLSKILTENQLFSESKIFYDIFAENFNFFKNAESFSQENLAKLLNSELKKCNFDYFCVLNIFKN